MKKLTLASLASLMASSLFAVEVAVPFEFRAEQTYEQGLRDLRRLHDEFGVRKVFVTGCPGLEVRIVGWEKDVSRYEKFGDLLARVRKDMAGTDMEIGWWNSPTLTYAKNGPFQHMVGGDGKEAIHACCPLDEKYVADLSRRIAIVASKAHPTAILFEDDVHFGWQRDVTKLTCYCPLHLAALAKKTGRACSREELVAICEKPTEENLAVRTAFGEVMREAMKGLGTAIRRAVDAVSPETRMGACACSTFGRDGYSIVEFARAIAGPGRPFIRVGGSTYDSNASYQSLLNGFARLPWSFANLPADIERIQELDTYPHNRFFLPDCFVDSLLFLGAAYGAEGVLYYGTQYLDDPLEQDGYFGVLKRRRAKLDAYRAAIADKQLVGVEALHRENAMDLRRYDGGPGSQNGFLLLSRMGLPQTEGEGLAKLLIGSETTLYSDAEIAALLAKGGVLIDSVAAADLSRRGFSDLIGADVRAVPSLPAAKERILPAAGIDRLAGRTAYNFAFAAPTAHQNCSFADLAKLRPGAETLVEFVDPFDRAISPAAIRFTNAKGGRIAVLGTSLNWNYSAALYCLRKKEMFRVLFGWLAGGDLPAVVADEQNVGIWCHVDSNRTEMVTMVQNFRPDVVSDLKVLLADAWKGLVVEELGYDGQWRAGSFAGEYRCGVARVFRLSTREMGSPYRLKGRTTKASPFYAPGEKMVFEIDLEARRPLPKDAVVTVERTGDDGAKDVRTYPAVPGRAIRYETSLAKSGFVRVLATLTDASGKPYRRPVKYAGWCHGTYFAELGAGVEPEKLETVPEPKDFDAFMASERAFLAKTPLKAQLTNVAETNGLAVYAVRIDCAGPRPVTGYLTVPLAARAGTRYPARLLTHGWGTGVQRAPNTRGTAKDVLTLEINAHGYELDRDDGYYKSFFAALETPEEKRYAFDLKQNANRETAYFRWMRLRVMRALQYLKTRPEWNGTDLWARGTSQGGLQTVWAAACGEGITKAEAEVPWCCDIGGSELGRNRGDTDRGAEGDRAPWYVKWTPALGYYDAANQAKRVPKTCDFTITRAGLGDYVCPPAGISVLYNNLPCKKRITYVQGSTHGIVPPSPNQTATVEEEAK